MSEDDVNFNLNLKGNLKQELEKINRELSLLTANYEKTNLLKKKFAIQDKLASTNNVLSELKEELAIRKALYNQQQKEIKVRGKQFDNEFKQIVERNKALSKGAISDVSSLLNKGGFQDLGIRDLDSEMKRSIQIDKQKVQSLKSATKEAKRFKAEYLSLLFFGQALQRTFGGLLSSSFQTFNRITEGTKMSNQGVLQLSAAWEFFKFSLIDALTQSGIFNAFISFVLKLIEYWSDLPDKVKSSVAVIIAAIAGIGIALSAIGTIKLGLDGLKQILTKDIPATKAALQSALGVLYIGIAIYEAVEAFKQVSEGKWAKAFLSAMQSGLMAGAFLTLKTGGSAGPYIVVGLIIELIKEGIFMQTLTRFLLGPIGSLVATSAQYFGSLFTDGIYNGLVNGFLDAFTAILKNISPGFAKLFGIDDDIDRMKKSLQDLLNVKPNNFDFGDQFKINYNKMVEVSKQIDKDISNYIDPPVVPVDPTKLYTPGDYTPVDRPTQIIQNNYYGGSTTNPEVQSYSRLTDLASYGYGQYTG